MKAEQLDNLGVVFLYCYHVISLRRTFHDFVCYICAIWYKNRRFSKLMHYE